MKKVIKIFILMLTCFLFIHIKANTNCVLCDGCSYYNISFETNGGKNINNMSVCSTCGDFLNYKLPDAERDGYTFEGWYSDKKLSIKIINLKDDINKINVTEVLDNNNCPTGELLVNLYAKWTKQSTSNCALCDGCSYYNISFETNGGKNINNMSVCSTCGDFLNYKLPDAERDGYTFEGWYSDKKLSIKINNLKDDIDKINVKEVLDNNNCPTGELLVNLYAKWNKVNIPNSQNNNSNNTNVTCDICDGCSYYNISFETNGGKKIDNVSVCSACPDKFNLELPDAEHDGYTFEGWYADENLSIKVNSLSDDEEVINTEEVLDDNNCPTGEILVKLYAKWNKVDIPNNQNKTIIFIISIVAIIVGLLIILLCLNKKYSKNKNI